MLREETAASPERMARALAGLRAFQTAVREPAPPPLPIVATAGRAMLRDGGGSGRPVVLVPSLINPPGILDLAPDVSLLRWIGAQGHHPYLVDWGTPGPADRDLTLADHVEQLLLPLLRTLDSPPVLVGYCLGGTLALAAALRHNCAGFAAIATPWRFAGYGPVRTQLVATWSTIAPPASALGVMPMEVLQAGFWQFDPKRTVKKYEAFSTMDPAKEATRAFVRLEDWANAGAPLPYAAARSLFEDCIAQDLPGRGAWQVDGTIVDPSRLACPAIEFVSLPDRIVPAATAVGLPHRHECAAGHVGMIVGSGARAQLWHPLANWIATLE